MPTRLIAQKFRGPVFIVGMPRSGTKLMRILLNQHPEISITLAESHFIPYFIRKFGNPPSLNQARQLERFVDDFLHSPFFHTMKKFGYSFDKDQFINSVEQTSWQSIFEYLFKAFGSKNPMLDMIWGDKTPGYVNHMPLLRAIFPTAKFLHMIRDPRDYCLSVKKSWGKNMYRAAHRWRITLEKARSYGEQIRNDYKEIHYEMLVSEPETTMHAAAEFLQCEFDNKMVVLGLSPEDVGDTKGKYGIVKDNTRKYLAELSNKELRRIEGIVGHVASCTGYDAEMEFSDKPLHPLALFSYKIYDGLASLTYHIKKENGLSNGAKRFVNHYRRSSWRHHESR
jgi:Sulfotransferase family